MGNQENSWTSSQLLYDHVMGAEDTDPRLKRSFERISAVCDEIAKEARTQVKRGIRSLMCPIYIAEVGRRCKATFGGPSGESITRNRKREPLKAIYIELRASELDIPRKDDAGVDPLSKIGDAGIRAYVRSLEQRNKVSEELIVGLAKTVKGMRPISLSEALAATSPSDADMLDLAKGVIINPAHSEVSAVVRKLLNEAHLAAFGLELRGGIFNPATGEELLSQCEVETLKHFIIIP